MSPWLLAAALLVPPLAMAVLVAMRADVANRLAATQLVCCLTTFVLAILSFAFDQPSFIDLALGMALLGVPGTYLTTIFMERWL